MPGPGLRRGALLLPLSLALCGDSMNLHGGCNRLQDPTIREDLVCTMEASGAVTALFACTGTWSRQPEAGSPWTLTFEGRFPGALLPLTNLVVLTDGPGLAGTTYALAAAPPAELHGWAALSTAACEHYQVLGLQGQAGPQVGTLAVTFDAGAPLVGTFEATLQPWVASQPYDSGPCSGHQPGPEGTSITLRGRFGAP